jgi:uncharacterized protein (DUF2461 family)
MALLTTSVARQHFSINHQWTNWEAVLSTLFVRQLRDPTIEELLTAVFSMQSVPRYFKQDKFSVYFVVRESLNTKDVSTYSEESGALGDVTRRQPAKTQRT